MSTRYRDKQLGLEVTVSRQAEKLIGSKRVPEFVKLLNEIMEAFGCHSAYVSKCGAAVEIHVLRSDGWRGVMKVKRG